jgi:hypothetical protein
LPEAVAAGARRIAVSAAVCQADDPRQAVAELRAILDSPVVAGTPDPASGPTEGVKG